MVTNRRDSLPQSRYREKRLDDYPETHPTGRIGIMIMDKPGLYWVYVLPSNTNFPLACRGIPSSKEEYLEHFGKWVIMGEKEELDKLARKLEPYMESRAIYSIKYTREPEHMFGLDSCVMCVFCDDREKEDIWEILAGVGVTLKAFVYDRQVIEMWQPGGLLMEKWIESFNIDPQSKEAEEIRNTTQENYDKWLASIDDGNAPWTFELI